MQVAVRKRVRSAPLRAPTHTPKKTELWLFYMVQRFGSFLERARQKASGRSSVNTSGHLIVVSTHHPRYTGTLPVSSARTVASLHPGRAFSLRHLLRFFSSLSDPGLLIVSLKRCSDWAAKPSVIRLEAHFSPGEPALSLNGVTPVNAGKSGQGTSHQQVTLRRNPGKRARLPSPGQVSADSSSS